MGLILLNNTGVDSSDTSVLAQPETFIVQEYEQITIPAHYLLRDGSLDVFASVIQRDFFTVRPQKGPLVLQARGFLGVIPLNRRLTIDVRPRVPIGNMSRILRISGEVPQPLEGTLRHYSSEPELYASLIDLYARALIDYVAEIRLRGMMREYVQRREITSFPRGRVLIGETLKSLQSRGIRHKAATSYFERTADVPVNRCLKYATWFLFQLRLSLLGEQTALRTKGLLGELNHALRTFDGVGLDTKRRFLTDAFVSDRQPLPRLRSYYRPALDLALAIVHQHAVTLDGPGERIGLPSLVLNMGDAFEKYVRNVLRSQSEERDWPAEVLDGNVGGAQGGKKRLFRDGRAIMATPDIVLRRKADRRSRYPLVLDVKYKPAHKLDRDDLNQIIAYGFSYGCRDVVLVQPLGTDRPAAGLRYLGEVSSLRVHQYAINLNANDLEGEESSFAESIGQLTTPAETVS